MVACSVKQIIAGAVLLKDVRAPNGRLLFKKGTRLTESHIHTLKSWGVSKIEIEKMPSMEQGPCIDPQLKEEYLTLFITDVVDDPFINGIFQICLKYIQEQYKGKISIPKLDSPEFQKVKDTTVSLKSKISLIELVESNKELCSLPSIYQKLMEVINDPSSSASNIAEVVNKDPSLCAKLLKLVNSPYFGLKNKIDTVSRAIAILGLEQLMLLTKGIIIVERFKKIPSNLLNMRGFWKHSIGVGLMSSLLSPDKSDIIEEKFMIGGLLHDIGKLIILMKMPDVYLNIIMTSKHEKIPIVKAEKNILGFDHADVGYILAKKWYFPENLQVMIKEHHNSCDIEDVNILKLGDLLTNLLLYGFSGNTYFPEIDKEIFSNIGIDIHELDNIFSIFFKQIKLIEGIIL